MSAKKGLERSGTVTRSLPDRSVLRFFAVALGTYPSCSTAFITRRRVFGETIFGRLKTRDTVAVDTPARLATSNMFGLEGSGIHRDDNTCWDLSRGPRAAHSFQMQPVLSMLLPTRRSCV